MDRDAARQEIRREWRRILPTITQEARQRVNGEASFVCPICGNGSGESGDGLTVNPKSKDGCGLKCFKCDFSGDVIDLYQKTTGRDYNTALADLAAAAGIRIDPYRTTAAQDFSGSDRGSTETPPAPETQPQPAERPTEDFTEYYEACKANLDGEAGAAAVEYLKQRGVIGPAMYHGAGYDPQERRIVIPCSSGFYIARSIDPGSPIRYKNPKGAAIALFNDAAMYAQDVQEVFITEGAFDALSIIEVGAQAVALNSTSNARRLIEMLERNPTKATLILCLDNDPAGARAAGTLQEGLQRLRIPFLSADIAGDSKDPNEALIKDRSGFYTAVQDAREEAQAVRDRQREEAQREQRERQQRTGAGMVDAFLQSVRSEKYKPIPTGIRDIDRAIGGGFIRQQLVLLGAAPGAGKTALAQWIFEGMAKAGNSCLYLNLEMSREQMLARSISRIAAQAGDSIRVTDILQGYKWTLEQEEAVTIAAEKYRREIAPQMIYNPEGVTSNLDSILEYIEAEAQQAEAAGMQAPLVVLDYLQIVTGTDREDDTTVIKRAVGCLKKYAMQHNTVVFLIIAHNREANKSGTVTMESGRDTSALEYSADLQFGLAFTRCLDRNGEKGKAKEALTPKEMQEVTLKVTKGRFARPGVEVDLHFNGETMTYTQLATEFQEMEAPTSTVHRRGRRQ